MRRVSVIARAALLFLSFAALYVAFNLVMPAGIQNWKNSNTALGVIPKTAISLHFYLRQYPIVIGAAILVFCLALALMDTAGKKKKE